MDVRAGDRVELHLPEMGVRDWFQVVAIEPCPEIESGEGRVVTGVFSYSRGMTYRMRIAGECEPLRVTEGHPFWDVDLGDWFPAGEGLVGRKVLIEGGETVVLGWEESGKESVYNIEVDGDHCYRVGEQGVLVHNASAKYPWTHKEGQTEEERISGNKCNVGAYFESTTSTILQIAAGPNTFPGALPEDILVWGGNTRLLAKTTETSLAQYTNGKKFGRVVVLNARNTTAGGSYTWVFEVASSVLDSGSLVDVVGGAPTQPGYDWIKMNIDAIDKLGFEFVEETPAPIYIKNMPVSGVSHMTGSVTTLPSQPDAVRLRFRKK